LITPLQSTNPELTEQQRQTAAKLARQLMQERARKEATESGVIAAQKRIDATQAFINKNKSNDGFDDVEQVE